MAYSSSLLLLSGLLNYYASTMLAHPLHYYTKANSIPSNSKPSNNVKNVIDSCWRSDPNWASNRKALAACAIGFGKAAMGGKYGTLYVVTDPSDNPTNPKPGTLRYGATQKDPLWIIFGKDMVISLKNVLQVSSFKTIDGRGVRVEIAYGQCLSVNAARHVIIHGISIHDCKPERPGLGDGITISASSDVWVDHCFLARCADGLIDIVHASTSITISNSFFTQHDKVMLLGHDDSYTADKDMKVTVVLNNFGPGLVQRMPRIRHGYAHVANNKYEKWEFYAIGGSANPTMLSQGNYFIASDNPYAKEVTKRNCGSEDWKKWNWRSCMDTFENGAYFVQSGQGSCTPNYAPSQSFIVAEGASVPSLTSNAGPLHCIANQPCS